MARQLHHEEKPLNAEQKEELWDKKQKEGFNMWITPSNVTHYDYVQLNSEMAEWFIDVRENALTYDELMSDDKYKD